MLWRETLAVLLRRWRLSIPALLLAIGLGVGTFALTPPKYEDRVSLLFLITATRDKDGAVNPYLNFGSTLSSTADIIRLAVTTDQAVEALVASGASGNYTVELDNSTPAPVLNITAQDRSARRAQATTRAVQSAVNEELRKRQTEAGAAPSTWVRTIVLSQRATPQALYKTPLQFAIIGGAFVLLLLLAAIFARERRRQAKVASSKPRRDDAQPRPDRETGQQIADRGDHSAPWPAPAGSLPAGSPTPPWLSMRTDNPAASTPGDTRREVAFGQPPAPWADLAPQQRRPVTRTTEGGQLPLGQHGQVHNHNGHPHSEHAHNAKGRDGQRDFRTRPGDQAVPDHATHPSDSGEAVAPTAPHHLENDRLTITAPFGLYLPGDDQTEDQGGAESAPDWFMSRLAERAEPHGQLDIRADD